MDARIVETHVSLLFFVGDRVYKLKKPVRFDFVDLSTREARAANCHREVALNRRLAPDVYEGVSDVLGPDGEPCDHLVVMRRMPVDRRLSTLAADGDPRAGSAVLDVARQLAAFHRDAERGRHVDAVASRDEVAALWRANADQLRHGAAGIVSGDELDLVDALAARYLDGRAPLFEARIAEGHVVDGHGDLLADDIYVLDDGPRLLDCLEFDDRLRYGDVAADVAFLAMDLERAGAPALADALLGAYQEAAGEPIPASLWHHYVAYRAQVRLLITGLRAAQHDDAEGREQARRLLGICLDHLTRAQVRLVLVGGPPGSGKSTLARGLGERLGWPVVRSDVVRKDLASLDPTTGAGAALGTGLYDDAHTDATYDELLHRAGEHLALGRSVILDASWTDAPRRAAARARAEAAGATVVELACVVSPEVAAARAEARHRKGTDASDADAAVSRALAARTAPWPEAHPIPTDGDRAEAVDRAEPLVLDEEAVRRTVGSGPA